MNPKPRDESLHVVPQDVPLEAIKLGMWAGDLVVVENGKVRLLRIYGGKEAEAVKDVRSKLKFLDGKVPPHLKVDPSP